MKWLHEHKLYPLNPSRTTGETIAGNALLTVAGLAFLPIIIGVGIVSLPVIGTIYAIDGVVNCIEAKKHKTRLQNDPWYRTLVSIQNGNFLFFHRGSRNLSTTSSSNLRDHLR